MSKSRNVLLRKYFILSLCGLLLLGTRLMLLTAAEPDPDDQLKSAMKMQEEGNYRDALQIFEKQALDPQSQGEHLETAFQRAASCLHALQQDQNLDSLLERVIAAHPQDWRVFWRAADLLKNSPHYGEIVAGKFIRGNPRGGGAFIDVTERNRVQSLIWLNTARTKMPENVSRSDRSDFYRDLAEQLVYHDKQAWKLQDLTNLEQLPDYPEPTGRRGRFFGRGFLPISDDSRAAPVDEQGNPIYIQLPESFDAARTDGERWRWALQKMAEANPDCHNEARYLFASFLQEQFGVRTLREWGLFLPRSGESSGAPDENGPWSVSSLKETETIARLATGVKRFSLPDEFNFIKIYQEIADPRNESHSGYQEPALDELARLFSDRQQYERSADYWKESLKRFPPGNNQGEHRQQLLDQIVKPWGAFEPVFNTVAGKGATVDFRFRNANSVSFEAHRIRVPELLSDIRNYLESRPNQLDWNRLQIENIGYRIVQQNEEKYRGEKVAEWILELTPRPHHFDRRITVTTPLQKGGAYLVTARIADGNATRIVLWLNDTAIVEKSLHEQALYFVSDAASGQPLNHLHVEFFGWKQEYNQQTKRHHLETRKFAEFTNQDGLILVNRKLTGDGFQWLVTTRDDQGRFAYLGFNGIWMGSFNDFHPDDVKTYIITDRPVYRPDQKVQFKFWIREARYGLDKTSRFAKQKFTVKIDDPQGTEVFSKELETDEYGGLAGEYLLPRQAPLGSYQISLERLISKADSNPVRRMIQGSNQFRVEEYKKPEFEVIVEAPGKPAQLGSKVTATIKAKYYYGAPVTQARIKLKVERSRHESRWYPVDPWDWLYGNGYWWFSPDYRWYPGFERWGCLAPRPSWIHWNRTPPELVLDQELPLGPDGTAAVEIDTSLAKALHGDEDHEYTVTAEVTDASRRTIIGTGHVLVSREPFKIFAWTSRGHYRVNDKIEARFQARSLDGKGIEATGKLQLLKITYKDLKPVETVVQSWELATDANGLAQQTLSASEAGQYRLSYQLPSRLSDGQPGPDIEGGYLFNVRGEGFNGSDFQYNDLELVIDKKHYAPGEKVRLMINTNRPDSTVLLFVRPVQGTAKTVPQVLHLAGKSTIAELDVAVADMPNFFVEALTVSDGRMHQQIQEIMVPPAEKVLNVALTPSQTSYLPGAKAHVEIKVTDAAGAPVVGAVALSVYDRAVEYISGGSNVPEIKEFFWKWKRSHDPQATSNLGHLFSQILKAGEISMQDLGIFGDLVANHEELDTFARGREAELRKGAPMSNAKRGFGMGGMGGGMGGMMPAAAPMGLMADAAMEKQAGGLSPESGGNLAAPTIRSNFADTAFWKADLITNERGLATVDFDMPENLSSWKIRAWGMGGGTDVGEQTAEVVTAKNLIVRLQSPRFFVETDEVLLSAIVHNNLKTEKRVQVELQLDGGTLELMADKFHSAGEISVPSSLRATVTIPANGEHRVDWRVKAIQPGTATITMKALSDEESDAMKMTFPVIVHGILKTESFSGVVRPDSESQKMEFSIPERRKPEQTRLELRYSPTLAGAMVDALPYLVDYPYGCTEQTLNRFVPTVITQGILQNMKLDLKSIRDKRTNLNAQQIGTPAERAQQWKQFDRNPVFDTDEVALMVKTGVRDLAAMQNSDGGWGWFSGSQEHSYPHTTAVVVHGLQIAVRNDIALPEDVLEHGLAWLKRNQDEQLALLQEGERHAKDADRKEPYKTKCSNLDAFIFSVLVDSKISHPEMQRFLYRDRLEISLYSQALLGLGLHELGAMEQRDMIVRNLDQFLKVDEENQTAYLDLPNQADWWFWYGNSIEANAHYLKLLTRVNAKDPRAAGLVKYLINNRRHGTWWNSTRDTAYCIEALADYLVASGENDSRMSVEIWLDGTLKQTVEITPEVLFTFNNQFVLEGGMLTSGKHTLEVKRKPLGDATSSGPLYFNAYVTNFIQESPITAAGLEIKVNRKIYKLVQDKSATTAVSGSRGQVIDQSAIKYKRHELKNLDEVVSGDLLEIELEIDSKNDYEYVVFEDWKLAGSEPVDLRSGYPSSGLGAYVEYRDQKVAFFLRQLLRGKHSVSYRVRAEIPGIFSALPTQAHAMYAPELKANADEIRLQFDDLPESADAK